MSLRINSNADTKNAEIWVPTGSKETQIKKCVDALIAMGYHCVIYRSGTRDLTVCTQALLAANIDQ